MKNILLIINPVSGNKDYNRYLAAIKEIFHDFNFKIKSFIYNHTLYLDHSLLYLEITLFFSILF